MTYNTHTADMLKLPHILALQLRSLGLRLIPNDCMQQISYEDDESETPHERDGVEEVCVARAGVDPEVVEGRP